MLRKSPKVSVVVPIYGVEKYLHQCVDSLLMQTLHDIEIILVDDGSPDNCPQIIDDYARLDKRVVAVHQPNGGYGRAVNHGIELAKGEYIGIIESDDWIEPDMYEKLYKSARENNTDVTKASFYKYNSYKPFEYQNVPWNDKYQQIADAPDGAFNIEEYPQLLIMHASIWSSIYRASFVKKIKLVESGLASYQDFPFMITVLSTAKRISVVKEYLVHYRMEEGQNSSTIRRDNRLILMAKQCEVAKDILKKNGMYDKLKEEFYYHAFISNIGFYKNIYLKYKKEYFSALKALFGELKFDKTFRYKYFSKSQKKMLKRILNNHYWASLIDGKQIRRFFFNLKTNKDYFMFTILGVTMVILFKDVPVSIKSSFLKIFVRISR